MKARLFSTALACTLALSLTACAKESAEVKSPATTQTVTQNVQSVVPGENIAAVLGTLKEAHTVDTVDLSQAEKITLSGKNATTSATGVQVANGTLTISKAGIYELSGSFTGSVVVTVADTEAVTLVLNGVDITSSNGAAIAATTADELTIYAVEGTTNTLTDAKSYADTADTAPNAALYSAADLSIIGPGTLKVTGNYNDAINTNDGLVIEDVSLQVQAIDDGVRGKDYVVINSGALQVDVGGHAIKADNVTDATVGYAALLGGTAELSAGTDSDGVNAQTVLVGESATQITASDDGVHADLQLVVETKELTVHQSNEGLESRIVTIAAGKVEVNSADDAINASAGTGSSGGPAGGGMQADASLNVTISGGEVTLNSEGDGFDSNGTAVMTGGTLVINGPSSDGNGAIDVNGTFDVSGGTLFAGGSAGMAATPSAGSAQGWVQFSVNASAGDEVVVQNSAGETVASYQVAKNVQNLVVSAAGITAGETYTVTVNGSNAGSAIAGQGAAGGHGGPGGARPPRP